MTASSDPDELRRDIERTRAELSENVDALADTANPKHVADRQVNRVKGAARGIKEHIMGAPDDPTDRGRVGDAAGAVSDRASAVGDAVTGAVGDAASSVGDRASAVGDAVSNAPARASQKARGNPLAAGLIAFGVGLLVSGAIPASQKEQRTVNKLQENLEPTVREGVGSAAREVAENLREPAQEAAESLKSTATEAVETVKDEGTSARDQVQQQAAESKENVQQQAQQSS